MTESRRERIAARAYQIWESEGRPPGMEAEHWQRAEQELARQDAAPQMGAEPSDDPPRPDEAPPDSVDTRPSPPLAAAPPLDEAEKRPRSPAPRPRRRSRNAGPPKSPPQQG